MKYYDIILDFEFTGLDNDFIHTNEIIQMKAFNMVTHKAACMNFASKKQLSAHAFLSHRVKRYKGKRFNADGFSKVIEMVGGVPNNVHLRYFTFSTKQDLLMLRKHGLVGVQLQCIQEMLQLTKHEYRLATEGRGLEDAYFIATGKIPKLDSHDGVDEISVITELYEEAMRLRKRKFLSFMPHGFCAGMPLDHYVANYRRNADGYRLNNNDLLSRSLDDIIESQESARYGGDDNDEDDF